MPSERFDVMQAKLDAIWQQAEAARDEVIAMLSADDLSPRDAKALSFTNGLLVAVVSNAKSASANIGRTTEELWS